MRKPRVLLVRAASDVHDPRLQKEMRSYVEWGFAVSAYTWDRQRVSPKMTESGDLRVVRFRVPSPSGRGRVALLMPLWFFSVMKYALTVRPDLIHACDLDAALPARVAARLCGAKFVFDIFDHYWAKSRTIPDRLRAFIRWLEDRVIGASDLVIVTSQDRRELLREASKVPVVLPNYPTDMAQPHWKKPKCEDLVISYVGLLSDVRGIRKLLTAAESVGGVRVCLAGEVVDHATQDAISRSSCAEYRGICNREEAVRIVFESDLTYAFYDPRLPINRYASPNKIFEAMMCSTAVVANRGPSTMGAVEKHDCGVLIPYENQEALCRALEEFKRERPWVRRLGLNGRKAFEEYYNWESVWQGYKEALKQSEMIGRDLVLHTG